jgi:integrase
VSVFKGGDSWRAQVYVRGRVVADEAGFKTRRDAKDWHDEKKRLHRSGGQVREATFDELLTHFKKWHLPSIRPGTKRRYMVDIDQRIEPEFRYLKLDAITPGMIEEVKAKWAKELSPKSVNNCLHTLRLLLNRAVRWKMLRESPYGVESLEVPKGSYPWWEKQEDIQSFLRAAEKSRYYTFYLTALETGLRYGELVGLDVGDVDLQVGTIHVHRQYLEREGRYGPPKHGKERWVDFNPEGRLGESLRAIARHRTSDQPLFVTRTGGLLRKSGAAHKYFKAIIKKAGVPVICFHGLRHTFASWYMIRHDNVWDLAAILGHSNIKTTMRYAHHSQRARRKPLDLASITQNSHRFKEEADVTLEDYRDKRWRDGRDSNPKPPKLKAVAI